MLPWDEEMHRDLVRQRWHFATQLTVGSLHSSAVPRISRVGWERLCSHSAFVGARAVAVALVSAVAAPPNSPKRCRSPPQVAESPFHQFASDGLADLTPARSASGLGTTLLDDTAAVEAGFPWNCLFTPSRCDRAHRRRRFSSCIHRLSPPSPIRAPHFGRLRPLD